MTRQAIQRPDRLGVALLVTLIVSAAAFSLTTAPRDNTTILVALWLGGSAVMLAAYARLKPWLKSAHPWSVIGLIVLTAACLRLATAIAPTSLSDDVYRYVWDGRLVAWGDNPYANTPSELAEQGLDGRLYDQLNSPDFITLYPPVSQAFFALGYEWAFELGVPPQRLLRLLLGLIDVLTVLLLMRLLTALDRPRHWAALYAWSPLVFWETSGGGHTEALMLPLVVLAILAALRTSWLRLGLYLGLAALAKTTALVVAPVLGWYLVRAPKAGADPTEWIDWRSHRAPAAAQPKPTLDDRPRRWRVDLACGAAALSVAVIALGYLPFWFDGLGDNLRGSVDLYQGYFIFNAPLYELSRAALSYREGITPDVADQILPLFGIGVAFVLTVGTLSVNGRSHRLPGALLAGALAYLLLSAVFHPWYLLLPLALGVVSRAWAPQLLAALVGLTYLAYQPAVGEVRPWMMAVQFAPFAVVLSMDLFRAGLGPILRRRARRKYRAFEAHLPDGCRFLDVGAGEGYVAACAAADGHDVQLVDVAYHNRTELPYETYDGERLPLDSGSFDVGLLAYVLHHCQQPDAVLREAARVCRRLVVLETVVETDFDRRLVTRLDHLANWFRGIPMEPLAFDSVEGWRERFGRIGLTPVHFGWLGRFVHKHVIFVLESEDESSRAEV